jgi:cytochrome c oxidase cbb3-type subunit 4
MQGVDVDMDINLHRGAIILVLLFSFLGLWVWAWSRKRKPAFHEASLLPLEEDNGVIPNYKSPTKEEGVSHVN